MLRGGVLASGSAPLSPQIHLNLRVIWISNIRGEKCEFEYECGNESLFPTKHVESNHPLLYFVSIMGDAVCPSSQRRQPEQALRKTDTYLPWPRDLSDHLPDTLASSNQKCSSCCGRKCLAVGHIYLRIPLGLLWRHGTVQVLLGRDPMNTQQVEGRNVISAPVHPKTQLDIRPAVWVSLK